ncbi:MAG: NERD domain-containing protein [Desulfobacteraceae bacterium]|nr:NERD domain-containing protein [Desulfobacteraceae bacterium]
MFKLLFNKYKANIKGAVGETVFGVASSLTLGKDYHVLKNIVIPAYDGTTQVDQVIVSKYGIFVIEIKNYKGWIFGKENDAKWTQALYKEKHSFQNPLRQNYKHIKSLEELTGISGTKIISVVNFSGEVTFKTPMPANVTKGIGFIDFIRSHREVILSDAEVERVITQISDNRLSGADHREYIRKRSERTTSNVPPLKEKPSDKADGFCIRCGKTIALNVRRPFCRDCFHVWNKYRNRDYKEV